MTYDLLYFFSSLIALLLSLVCTYFPVNFNVLCLYCILLSFYCVLLYCIAALLCEIKYIYINNMIPKYKENLNTPPPGFCGDNLRNLGQLCFVGICNSNLILQAK